jgi:hypothetical protein
VKDCCLKAPASVPGQLYQSSPFLKMGLPSSTVLLSLSRRIQYMVLGFEPTRIEGDPGLQLPGAKRTVQPTSHIESNAIVNF